MFIGHIATRLRQWERNVALG